MELSNVLNPDSKSRWILIENDPSSLEFMEASPPDLIVLKGFPMDYSKKRPGSYHHALALIKAIRNVKSRFALLLDPDFYIVRKNWIADILDHIKKNKLAFFGTPWNPKWCSKYRYFPNVNCMFIDLEQVDKNTLAFRPGQDGDIINENPLLLTKLVRYCGIRLIKEQYRRRLFLSSQDTGYHVYAQYAHKKEFKHEIALPVFKELNGYPKGLLKLIYKGLPEYFNYNPKRLDSYSQIGFRELGFIDVEKYGWEEYLWKNKPFSLHVRRTKKDKFEAKNEMNNLHNALTNLTGIKIPNMQ